MKNRWRTIAIVSILIVCTGFSIRLIQHWKLDRNPTIAFENGDVKGSFKSLKGDVVFDPSHLSASYFSVSVDVNSMQTEKKLQTKHAKSAKWFDADQYPVIAFASDSIRQTDTAFVAYGWLQIKDVKKHIGMAFDFKEECFYSSFAVNRLDFNVGSNTGAQAKVDTMVHIDLKIPVKR